MKKRGERYTEEQKADILLLWKSYEYSFKKIKEETNVNHNTIQKWANSELGKKLLEPNHQEIATLDRYIKHQKNKVEKSINDFYDKAFDTRYNLIKKINDLIGKCDDPFTLKYLVSALKVVDNIVQGNDGGDGSSKKTNTWITNIIQKIDQQIVTYDKINNTEGD